MIEHLMAAVPTGDYSAALAWYERFFGRPPDVAVTDDESMWQASECGWVYLVTDAPRAGRALLTLMVDDLDVELAQLAERGIEIEVSEIRPGLFRKAEVFDPDGNHITIGEDLTRT